jgi:hypothetical protein
MFEFAAAFDLPTVERLETTAQQSAKKNGIDRRIALAILTRSSAELRQAAAQDPEAFLFCTECLGESIVYYATQIEVLRAVKASIWVALSEGAGVQSGELEHAAHSE